jgi:hypothetical protein
LIFGRYPSSCFYLKQRFGDWTVSASSGKRLLIRVKSIELIPISGLLKRFF